jgi:hypothetical protein
MTVVLFSDRRVERERMLLARAKAGLEALANDVAALAVLRSDGTALFGPLPCPESSDFEAVIHIRRTQS